MYDFVAIGDMVTDAFIKLKDASAHIDIDHDTKEICMTFGDKIPYDEVFEIPAVGNSANASIAAARLGLRSALVSNIGNDRWGKDCLKVLKKEGVSKKFININKGKKTNYHYVLWFESDRTILVKHEEYPYVLPNVGAPRWIYLSSMGAAGESMYDTIAAYLKANPNVRLAFQPGTYQMKLGTDRLKDIYAHTKVFICNIEEAQRILQNKEQDVKKLMQGIRALGPKIVLLTDGPAGAYAYSENSFWKMPTYPDPKPPYERTGAGDAFASTFVSALALGLSVEQALMWAPVNSMSVVQYVGAREGLLTREKLEAFLKSAPQDYKPQAL